MSLDFLPADHLSPGTAFKFTFTRATNGLMPLPQSIALVGMQSNATAAPDESMPVTSPDDAAALLGEGSELALMVDAAFRTGQLFGQMPRVYAVPLTPPTGGVAAVTQVALSGKATRSGRALLRVAGVNIETPARADQTAAELADALRAVMTAATRELPVAPGGTGAALLATHKTAGAHGNDVVIEVVEMPEGVTAVVTRTTDGAGTADISAALDNLLALDVNGVALADHTVAAVQAASEHASIAWQPMRKRWRHMFVGETGNSSTVGALTAIDRYWVVVGACKGSPSLPCQIAATLACITFATGSPNYNLQGYDELPLFAPRPADQYSPLDTEELLQLGATPLVAVASRPDRLEIVRLVTTQRTISGARTQQLVDLSVSLTTAYGARQLDQAYKRAFGPRTESERLISESFLEQVRDMIIATLHSMEEATIIRGLDARLDEIQVTASPNSSSRVLARVPLEPTPQLMQVAFSVNVYS